MEDFCVSWNIRTVPLTWFLRSPVFSRKHMCKSGNRCIPFNQWSKGHLISKENCQAVNSSKKRTNEFVFTTMRCVFVRFFGRNWRYKKTFEFNWPLPKAEIFGRSWSFLIFSLWLPKFYSKYSAFSFVLKMDNYSFYMVLSIFDVN